MKNLILAVLLFVGTALSAQNSFSANIIHLPSGATITKEKAIESVKTSKKVYSNIVDYAVYKHSPDYKAISKEVEDQCIAFVKISDFYASQADSVIAEAIVSDMIDKHTIPVKLSSGKYDAFVDYKAIIEDILLSQYSIKAE